MRTSCPYPKTPSGLIETCQRVMSCRKRQEICDQFRRNVRPSVLIAFWLRLIFMWVGWNGLVGWSVEIGFSP